MVTIFIKHDYVDGFSVKVKGDDPGLFRLTIDTLKSFIPAHFRSYNPALKEWQVSEDANDRLQRWLAYCRLNLHAELDWLNGDPRQQQRQERSWSPPPPPRRHPTKEDAYRTLYLQPNSPPDLVRHVFKYLATVHHPDKPTGDEERMKAINAAYKQLLA